MKKIVTLGITLSYEHINRLSALGDLEILESPASVDDLLQKANGADILYSNGSYLLESLPKLKNIFVTYPYIELGSFDTQELEKNGVLVANTQGSNKNSIVERVMYMTLSLFRKFGSKVRIAEDSSLQLQESLEGKNVLIVGHGSIGSQIGVLCQAFGMQVEFFQRGEDGISRAQDKDLIINALNCNATSKNLLDASFFMHMKKGSYYIAFGRQYTYDLDGLIKAIDAEIVAGAGIDCDPEKSGDTHNDFYQKALSNVKILVTPHIAFTTTQASTNGKEFAVQNIEAFVRGKPVRVLKKK